LSYGNYFGGSSDPVLNLIAGNYTLAVYSNTDHTGSYSFRLSDMASATPISPGTAVSGSLNPGNSTNIYQFNANAGDPLYFDVLSGGGSPNTWRLIDPNGQQLFYNYFGTQYSGLATAPYTGTYTLLFEGYIGNTSPVSYSFNVQDLTTTAVPLTLGSLVTGSITQPAVYSFTLANAAHLYFDSLTNDSTLNWSLLGPTGTLVNQRSFTSSDGLSYGQYFGGSSDPVLNLNAGSYTLFVAGGGGSTNYSFRLSDLASATPISPGTAVSESLNPGDSTNIYQFHANAGDPLYFDVLSGGGSPNTWRLIDPNGQQLFYNYFGTQYSGLATAPYTGTYTLLFEGYIGNTSPVSYSFNVQDLTTTAVPLTLGSVVTGSITQPTAYNFTLANPAHLYFDSLTNDSTLNWSLLGPTGTLVNQRSFASSDGLSYGQYFGSSSDPVLNLNAGSYTLFVGGVAVRPTTASGCWISRRLRSPRATMQPEISLRPAIRTDPGFMDIEPRRQAASSRSAREETSVESIFGISPGPGCRISGRTRLATSLLTRGTTQSFNPTCPTFAGSLRTISNFVGNCTGRSPGFAARRMRST
jgi:hypothetical protein